MKTKIVDNLFSDKICPRCQSPRLKPWEELDKEEKEIVRRLSLFANFPEDEKKCLYYCTFCWFSESELLKLRQA